jgi:hypothetical protein
MMGGDQAGLSPDGGEYGGDEDELPRKQLPHAGLAPIASFTGDINPAEAFGRHPGGERARRSVMLSQWSPSSIAANLSLSRCSVAPCVCAAGPPSAISHDRYRAQRRRRDRSTAG